MKIAWLADETNTDGSGAGGAEMTQAEFRAAAPEGVETVYVALDELDLVRDCDLACVFNVAQYPEETIRALSGKRVIRYWNDVAPHGSHDLTLWLLSNSFNVFCSALHYEQFPWRNGQKPEYALIPPPVDLEPFRNAAESAQERAGAVSVAQWRGWGKTPYLSAEWGRRNGVKVDFYGGGQCAPDGSIPVPYEMLPQLLARYETFVYLPTAIEPFCRTTVEAWAAGCQIVSNRYIGANEWLENDPEAIERAAEDFWRIVLDG